MDGEILNLIFCLVCGRPLVEHRTQKIEAFDIWDYEPGVRLLRFMYSGQLNEIITGRIVKCRS